METIATREQGRILIPLVRESGQARAAINHSDSKSSRAIRSGKGEKVAAGRGGSRRIGDLAIMGLRS